MNKCVVCGKPSMKNVIVCSDNCQNISSKLFELNDKYFPTNGCDNCWGDLHNGCSDKCKEERKKSSEFGIDLWLIIRLIYPIN